MSCMYICMYIYIYVFMYVCMYVCIINMHIYRCVHSYTKFVKESQFAQKQRRHASEGMTYVYLYVCLYVYMYACMCICIISVHKYTCTHFYTKFVEDL